MMSPALAFAAGSPAGSPSSVAKLAGLPGMAAGMPSVPSLTQTSSATGQSTAGFDNSGFVVNIGGGNASASDGVPWLLLAAAGVAAYMLRKG